MPIKDCVLVVDDEEMNRNVLSRRLERSGFQVEVACDGADALKRVSQQPFDLILLDQMMPGTSGADVLKELRTHYSASSLPVIMVTALADSGNVAAALDMGANDYITKPVDFTVALARIRAQLSRKHAEEDRRVSEERYELAARAANDGLWDWDLASNRMYYSARWKSMMGLAESVVSAAPEEWFGRVHSQDLVQLKQALQEHLDKHSEAFEAEYRIKCHNGEYRWMAGRGAALRNAGGEPVRMAGSQSDITDKKTLDVLTGLPNRLLFEDRLRMALDRTFADPDRHFATLFIDLDRFKLVNDTLGHVAGDNLLIQFAARLKAAFPDPVAVVARLSGDEFAVLLPNVGDTKQAVTEGERLIRALKPAYCLDGREFFASASAGIVISRPEHTTPDEVIRDADIAMYDAKNRGRGRWAIFDETMRERAVNRLTIEADLRSALGKGQLVVHYQPRVDLKTKQIRGFEALLRWRHPVRGLVPPDQFISIAEETGMIREIGLWVMGEACSQIRLWRDEHPDKPWLDVAVNVSPVQLRDPCFVGHVAQILADTGVPSGGLQIEITESTLCEKLEEARETLTALKALGIGLKLDDFATGYSCLQYLYRLPFDSIKIDRSFTKTIDQDNEEGKELVRTIMSMAANLGLGVIAEGVESKDTADFLRDEGCRFGQGYFFSEAVDAASVGRLLSLELVQ